MKKLFNHAIQHTIVFLFVIVFVTSCGRKEIDIEDTTVNDNTNQTTSYRLEPQTFEALLSNYQKAHKDEKLDVARMTSIYNKFMDMMKANEKFGSKKPAVIQPIYAYGVSGVAYHEIWFVNEQNIVEGWVLMSATNKDYPIVNFSHSTPYSADLAQKAGADGKIYRFGVSYYALEKNGEKVADYGQMPSIINNTSVEKSGGGMGDSKNPNADNAQEQLKEGIDYFPVKNYSDLKQLFAKFYFSEERARTARRMLDKINADNSFNNLSTRGAYQYRWVSGAHGYLTQIPANTTYNPYACWSGCNNNAWANIYAWWDKNQSKTALIPTTSTGETSPLYRNTFARQASTDPVQMYCRSVANTYCNDGGGWTLWSNCGKGAQYAGAKGYGYTYYYWWCNSAGCNVNLANYLTDGIANNYRPVHIGANAHFYVGYGWTQWDTNTDWTWAYCYPGWRENDTQDVWISWHDFNAVVKMTVH